MSFHLTLNTENLILLDPLFTFLIKLQPLVLVQLPFYNGFTPYKNINTNHISLIGDYKQKLIDSIMNGVS